MYTVETWTVDSGMTARVVIDENVESPREWDNVATLVQLSDDYLQPDPPSPLADALRRAWQHFHDLDRVARYARAYLSAAAVDTWDDPTSTSRVLGVITDVDAAREHLPAPAETLRAELDTYRQWATGCVYGVIVTAPDGRDASLWGCYDDEHGFPYLHEVATDLVAEIAAEPVTATLDGVTVSLYRAGADQHVSVLIDTADADLTDDPAAGPLGLLVTLNDGDLYDTTDREVSRS